MEESVTTTHIVSAFDVPIGPIPLSMCQSVHTAMCEAREKILRDLREARRTRARFPMQPRPDLDRRVDWHLERLYYVTDVIDCIEAKVVDGSLPLRVGTWEIALGWKLERLAKADFDGGLPFVQFTPAGVTLDGIGDRSEFEPSWQAAIRRDVDGDWEECDIDDAEATTLTDWISDMHAHNARRFSGGGS